MAKITRKDQKVFAGNLTATGNLAKFGSLAVGSPSYSTDPDVIQQLSLFTDSGWAAATLGNKSPAMQDMNALFYIITRQLAYFLQQGIPEWSATTTYYIPGVCTHVDYPGVIFYSVQNANIGNAVTDTNWWLPTRPPAPTATLLGGVKSLAPTTHNFLTGIGTDGVATRTQPAYADISGLDTAAQQPVSAFDPAGAATAAANAALASIATRLPKAWVYFNSNEFIYAQYNVSAVSRTDEGRFTITFTNPVSSGTDGYGVFGNCGASNGSSPGSGDNNIVLCTGIRNADQVSVGCWESTGGGHYEDPQTVSVMIV